jgi:NAD(P)-dependent dehydrogenase (short-subunit alcohol dehydrogenase family)
MSPIGPPAGLQGGAIIVTGGASGIGLASAQAAVAAGAAVMVADRDAAALDHASEALADSGGRIETFEVDVTDAASVDALVQSTVATFGRVTGLVTSAGIERPAPALELTEEAFDQVLRVNLTGSFLCAKAVAAAMVAAGSGGSIVTVSSALAFSGRINAAQYAASKGGVVSLTKSLAIEWGSHGIRVNSVAPGFVDTPITAAVPDEYRAAYASRTPLGRVGTANDVATVIRFLLTEDAGYVTGQTVVVNGGFLMPS